MSMESQKQNRRIRRKPYVKINNCELPKLMKTIDLKYPVSLLPPKKKRKENKSILRDLCGF